MEKREKILNVAMKLFVNNGEQSTSMKLVAKELDMGMATIYRIFPSKDFLINSIYLKIKTDIAVYILNGIDESKSIESQFKEIWLNYITYTENHDCELKFLDIFCHSKKLCPISKIEVEKKYKKLVLLLEKGIKDGVIKEISVNYLMTFVIAAISAAVISSTGLTKDCKDVLVGMAWDAIKI